MTLTVDNLSSANMFDGSTVDPGPFTCPMCRKVSFNPDHAIHGWCEECGAATGVPFAGPGTKILVVGDIGGDLEWLEGQVIPYAQATGCAMIMQCGDFGFVWDKETVAQGLDNVHRLLEAAGLTLTFLPGNRENHPLLEWLAVAADRNEDGHAMLRPTICYTGRVSAWTWDGVRMAAVGCAPSVDRDRRITGTSWWPEEMLRPDEAAAAAQLGPVDILFSHDAPIGVPLHLMPDLASTVHRTYMAQIGEALVPAYWFHAHYNESLFYRFHHLVGAATVRGLGCYHSDVRTDSMVAINLDSIRAALNTAHYGPEE